MWEEYYTQSTHTAHTQQMLQTDLNDQGRALSWFKANGTDLNWVMQQLYGSKAIPVDPPRVRIASVHSLLQMLNEDSPPRT